MTTQAQKEAEKIAQEALDHWRGKVRRAETSGTGPLGTNKDIVKYLARMAITDPPKGDIPRRRQ